ncbi:MAG TPA: YfhO family protein [Thermomicrobiales bacterium]|nr:YfhO family protein [Thermomicrobiales bacterium]
MTSEPVTTTRSDVERATPSPALNRSTNVTEGPGWFSRSSVLRELVAVGVLVALALLVAWNRSVYDAWIGRHDILAQWVPWNTLLGDRLRDFDLPGWNPHQFSGAPIAGDPQSGWMYFPTMLTFGLIPDPIVAFKVKIGFDFVFAALSTYALARRLDMNRLGSIMAGVVFAFGPLSFHETHCCAPRALVALFIPTALLGVEVALRAASWQVRVFGLALGAFAVSQVLAAFPGQGAYDACLMISAWVVYRTLIAPPTGRPKASDRLVTMVVTGGTIMVGGVLLNLAALWPRLETYLASTIGSGGYDGVVGYDVGPYDLAGLLRRLVVDSFGSRDVTIAAGAIVLMLMAPFLARTRFAVPFFAGMTVVVLTLTLPDTPLHAVFRLFPMWYDLHIHNVPIILSVLMIGPAILAGATVDRLWSQRGRPGRAPVVFLPLILLLIAYAWFPTRGIEITPTPIVAATIVTLLVWLMVDPRWTRRLPAATRMYRAIPAAIILVTFLQPMGLEVIDSTTGESRLIRGWQGQWTPDEPVAEAAAIYTRTDGPGGSGQFLMDAQESGEHSRYISYIGTGTVDEDNPGARGYAVQRRYDPHTQAAQANGRSVYLGLYEMQGYNPIQLSRYADMVLALNGAAQDYHFADPYPPLRNETVLDMLNVGHVLIDRSLPPERRDVAAMEQNRELLYEDEWVAIYDNPGNLGPAWVTHDVIVADRQTALNRISQIGFRPDRVAVVEGDVPPIAGAPDDATGSATLVSYAPERITYTAESSHDGFLVMSEVYDEGWSAFLDGEEVPLYPTNVGLRGIALPAGTHEVELRYEPLSLRLGFAVSVVAHAVLVAALLTGAWWVVRSRRSVPHRSR